MCSDVARPTRAHVRPASVDLYTPSPKCALRWLLFSPDPTQTTLESFGSTTTQQRLNEPWSSNTGVKVMPRLTVFHNPPNALATYHTLGFFGSISMSWMRPVASAGPTLRSSSPLSAGASKPLWPDTIAVNARAAAAAITVSRLMWGSLRGPPRRAESRTRCGGGQSGLASGNHISNAGRTVAEHATPSSQRPFRT